MRTLTDEGLLYQAQALNGETAAVPQWYIAPFGNNYVPTGEETAATAPGLAGELTNYTGNRKPFTGAAELLGGGQVQTTNESAKAEFVFDATTTVYGYLLTSVSTKGSTGGICRHVLRADEPRVATAGVTFEAVITLTDVAVATL